MYVGMRQEGVGNEACLMKKTRGQLMRIVHDSSLSRACNAVLDRVLFTYRLVIQ